VPTLENPNTDDKIGVDMYARRDGDRIRLYWQNGQAFWTFYDIRKIARDLANCELTALERVIYHQVFADCINEIPIPRRLKRKVAMKLMEIQLDRTL
jgi:hypothetical protein